MEMILIKQDSPEWEYMWGWLENHPINQGQENPSIVLNEGEAWQYMGSYSSTSTIHEFRHRNHPNVGQITLKVHASDGFNQDDIFKSLKVK